MLKTRGCGGSGPFRPGSIHPRELLFTEPCDQRAGFGTGYRDVDFAEQETEIHLDIISPSVCHGAGTVSVFKDYNRAFHRVDMVAGIKTIGKRDKGAVRFVNRQFIGRKGRDVRTDISSV